MSSSGDQDQINGQFTCFPHLPPELRQEIFRLAIRDHTVSVEPQVLRCQIADPSDLSFQVDANGHFLPRTAIQHDMIFGPPIRILDGGASDRWRFVADAFDAWHRNARDVRDVWGIWLPESFSMLLMIPSVLHEGVIEVDPQNDPRSAWNPFRPDIDMLAIDFADIASSSGLALRKLGDNLNAFQGSTPPIIGIECGSSWNVDMQVFRTATEDFQADYQTVSSLPNNRVSGLLRELVQLNYEDHWHHDVWILDSADSLVPMLSHEAMTSDRWMFAAQGFRYVEFLVTDEHTRWMAAPGFNNDVLLTPYGLFHEFLLHVMPLYQDRPWGFNIRFAVRLYDEVTPSL